MLEISRDALEPGLITQQEAPGPTTPSRRPIVVAWALLGAAVVALEVYVYAAWVVSGDFRPAPLGATPPGSVRASAWVLQTIFALVAIGAIAWVIRGCIRQRRLTLDAKLWLGWMAMITIDPAANWLRPQMSFNAYYVNRGSWVQHIPFWSTKASTLPQPFLIETASYAFMIFVTIAGDKLMAWIKRRHPRITPLKLTAWAWLAMSGFVLAIEAGVVIPSGWLIWSRTLPYITLWRGTRHAMPLAEVALWGGTITAMVALRHFAKPDGSTFVDNGLSRLTVSNRTLSNRTVSNRTVSNRTLSHGTRTVLSTLAVIGFAFAAMGGYAIGMASLGPLTGAAPTHIPAYFRNGICVEHARSPQSAFLTQKLPPC
jgi:Spirocyclase AveC-like